MYVTIDLQARRATLADPANFKQFHVVIPGGDTAAGLAVLGADGAPTEADDHVWISVAAVRGWAEGQVDSDWDAGFEKMLEFAGSAGWLDDDRSHIQAHVEAEGI